MSKKIPNFLVIVYLFFCLSNLKAATLRGHILDKTDKQPLIGASISEENDSKLYYLSSLDGSFSIKKLPVGKHVFIVNYIGYQTEKRIVNIGSQNEVLNIDFLLSPNDVSLNQVEITAQANKDKDAYSTGIEKNSANILNVMSAENIQLSPDITVANSLQRMSGITVQKTANNGDAQYAIIRGMDKRYNYTLINGVKIPSPDSQNRYIPMDIFPSGLISRLEVVKALTPDMEGDAIGGAMNLVLKDAPDKLTIDADLGGGYNQINFDRKFTSFNGSSVMQKSPAEMYGLDYHAKPSDFPMNNLKYKYINPAPNFTGTLSIGDRFFNKRLGIILSASNQSNYSGSDGFFASPRAQPNEGNQAGFETKEQRSYSVYQNRTGLHNKIDYIFNGKNRIELYNAYFVLDKLIARHTVTTSLSTGVGNVDVADRSQTQKQGVYNSTLKGYHTLSDQFYVDWAAAYSRAWAKYPDDVELVRNSTNIDQPTLQGITHKWSHNNDIDLSGYLNISYHPEFLKGSELKAGGMYRHKNRDNYYNEYSLDPVLVNNAPQIFTSVENAQFTFTGVNADLGSSVNQNDYNVTENVAAWYGEGTFQLTPKLSLLAGARVEQTDLHYTTPMPNTFVGKSGKQFYEDLLPSAHLTYKLDDKQNLRLSYYTSISRPGFYEIIPYFVMGDYYNQEGNPYLKRSKAYNFDFRYELFQSPTEKFFGGLFYKSINDPIEFSLVADKGPSSLQLKPQNFGTAQNYGLEFVYIKYFHNLGFSINYTFTHSNIRTQKASYHRDANNNLTVDSVMVSRPMQGQAQHIGNLSLLYKNNNQGLDIQLSAEYTGKYIAQVSGYVGLDYWSSPATTLDLSFEKSLSKKINLKLFGKARNLLNTAAVTRIMQTNPYYSGSLQLPDQDSKNSIVVQKERYKQDYLLGLRYSF